MQHFSNNNDNQPLSKFELMLKTNSVYFFDSNEFEVLVERGELGSPQGLVLDDSGGFLYVADYIGGLYRISTQDGSLVRLRVAASITDFGIEKPGYKGIVVGEKLRIFVDISNK